MTNKERIKHTLNYFMVHQPVTGTELKYTNPFELAVAVILSAQCTDKRVNMITPPLLKRFPDAVSMAGATPEDVYEYIKSCTYPNNKAKHLTNMARVLVEEFGGKMPDDPALLQRLPGVGRKTANVIASVAFGKPVMPVDTHVFRVSDRIGLVSNAKTPIDAENQLTQHIPDDLIGRAHHWLILHGRYICKARRPLCEKCGLTYFCRYFSKNRQK